MMSRVKDHYIILKASGDLLEMFPDYTGEWRKDKVHFTEYFNSTEELIEDLEVDIIFDEEEEDF